jgi:hypothetical protein
MVSRSSRGGGRDTAQEWQGDRCTWCLEKIKSIKVNGEWTQGNLDGTKHDCKQGRTRNAILGFLERGKK